MKTILWILLAMTALTANAQTENFDSTRPGSLPDGWEAGVTGSGNPWWAVDGDDSAPGPGRVLQQIGQGTFPWCVKKDVALTDGFVEVRFKAKAARKTRPAESSGAGRMGTTITSPRANALENNVSLYYPARASR